MAVSLNGITLNPSIIWVDEFSYSPVAQKVTPTLDGGFVVYARPSPGNRPITLVAVEDQGWFTRAMVIAVKELEKVPLGQFPLIIGTQSFNVMFRSEEAPAFSVSPLIPRSEAVDGDYFIGTLKLFVK